LENILDDVTDEVGITLSASAKSIVNLMKVLTSGKAFTKVKDDLLDVSLTAEMLGISFENWQIGAKRRNKNESLFKSVVQVAKTNSKSKFENEIPNTTTKSSEFKFKCKMCGFRASNKQKLERHVKTHSNMARALICKKCNISFKNQKGYKFHQVNVHEADLQKMIDNNVEKEEEHGINDEINMNLEDDNINIESTTPKANDNMDYSEFERDVSAEVEYLLDEDEDSTSYYDALFETEHTKKESGEFVCNSCEKVYSQKWETKRHWIRAHSGIKYPCTECDFISLGRKDNLDKHMKKKHKEAFLDRETHSLN